MRACLSLMLTGPTPSRFPSRPAVSRAQVSDGVLDAPVGGVITILFMHVVGHATLMAWNAPLATQATEMWAAHATKLLAAHSGYMVRVPPSPLLAGKGRFVRLLLLAFARACWGEEKQRANSACALLCVAPQVELAEGLLLAAFGFAHDAVAFALTVRDTMIGLEWPAELLEHELCEELAVAGDAMAAAAAGGLQARSGSLATVRTSASGDERLVLQRGPRLRVGIDSSPGARPLVNTTTGRMVYRGRCARSARVTSHAARTSNASRRGSRVLPTALGRTQAHEPRRPPGRPRPHVQRAVLGAGAPRTPGLVDGARLARRCQECLTELWPARRGRVTPLQVFQQVQQAAEDGDAAAASGLMMQSQGPAALKGVGTINVYSCSWKPAPVAFKAR